MSHRWTKRPQNACRQCGHMWYPRGKDVSDSCPRCGSGDVELAIMALFRAIGAIFVALFLFIKILAEGLVALAEWAGKQVSGLIVKVRAWSASRSASRSAGLLSGSGSPARPLLPTPKPSPTGPSWVGRMWSAIYRSVAEFFAWVASVNDDITGANDNPNVFAAVAKLLVILLFAGAAFALAILVCRSLGFL